MGCACEPIGRYDVRLLTTREKTAAIRRLAIEGATQEPTIRRAAVGLIRGLPRGTHVQRLARLHAFVRDSVDYHREPIEMIHKATHTIREGGDCDDQSLLLGALAWALKYPFRIVPLPNEDNAEHYSVKLGWPETELPDGDDQTQWLWADTTVRGAMLGEHPYDAVRRVER